MRHCRPSTASGSSNSARSTTAPTAGCCSPSSAPTSSRSSPRRRAAALPLAPAGRVPRVRDAQLEQAQRGARPQDRRRSPGAARPGRDRRRAHRELRAGHDGAPPARPGAAARAQPAAGRGLRQGLRVHGPVRAHVGHGHHRAGDVRQRRGHRRAGRAPDQVRRRVRRLLRRHPPVRRDQLRPCSSASAPDGARSSRSRCTTPSTRCWRRASVASTTTPTGSCPSAPGTGTRAWPSRRTTSTRRATAGSRSSASPSGTGAAWQPRSAGRSSIDDPRFRTEKDRVANIDAVDEAVSSCTRTRTRAELLRDLQAAGVPCAPVKSIREVDTDEHLIQRGMIQFVEHPARGRVPVAGCPLRLSDSPVGPLRPAPLARRVHRGGPRGARRPRADGRRRRHRSRRAGMSSPPEPGTPLAAYYAADRAPRRAPSSPAPASARWTD